MQTRSLDPSKDPRLPTAPRVLWVMDGRWEGAYVPPSSRGGGSRAEPPRQREPISDRQLLTGKAPAGRAVVFGSEPRLEWFTLALWCWSCLLPGWGGRGRSVPSIPMHQCGGDAFWRVLFLLFESCKRVLGWPGWFSIARTAGLSEAAGCQRSLSAGDAAGEPAETLKREFWSRACALAAGSHRGAGQGVRGMRSIFRKQPNCRLLEKTGALCFPEIQKPKFKALEVSVSGKPAQSGAAHGGARLSRIPRALCLASACRRLLCHIGAGRFGGNTHSSSLACPLSKTIGLKARGSSASAGPQLLGLDGCCGLYLLPWAGGGEDLPRQQGGLQSRAAGYESLTGRLHLHHRLYK